MRCRWRGEVPVGYVRSSPLGLDATPVPPRPPLVPVSRRAGYPENLKQPEQAYEPMLNAFEVIRANPTAKRFEIGKSSSPSLTVRCRMNHLASGRRPITSYTW